MFSRRAIVPELSFLWLGHPRILAGGAPVRLETRKNTALLALLTISGRTLSRERLAATFWPDFDGERAPANLRRSLASLRASLPGEWLAADRDEVSIRKDATPWIDARCFEAILAELKTHGHDADEACPRCRGLLEEAAGLYQGDFLEGFSLPDCPEFDDWQGMQREGFRAGLGWVLERLARAEAAAGDIEAAARTARRWAAMDRLHEPAQTMLVGLLARGGQRSAAIRHYEEFAKLLMDELVQEPGEEARRVYDSVLAGLDPSRVTGRIAGRNAGREGSPAREPGGTATESRGSAFSGLLATKLALPPFRSGQVPRKRLSCLIEEGMGRGMVLVSAPAGFGKSTILAEWASGAGLPIAWLSLDSGDNDLPRFLSYLSAACDRAIPGLGADAAQVLRAMPPPPADAILTRLINGISGENRDMALVLDDYQFIRAQEVHEAMRFLVERRPLKLRVALATREDPPLPMARLRSQGMLREIRAEGLRFTLGEARQFLVRSMSLPLSDAQVETLENRTEGWIAGLQMAALSLAGRDDVDGFLASFGGTHRHVMDYLAEEVFSRQSPERRSFLLETSILARMCAGLCEAVTSRPGAQETLEALDRANLFLVPLDDERGWYRYHHLFADLLRHRLERERSCEDTRLLRQRAAAWLESQGDAAEAIQHYLAAGDHPQAARVIALSYQDDIFERSGVAQVLRWCREIPRQVASSMPAFGVAAGWALGWAGKGEEASEYLDEAEKALGTGSAEEAEARTLRGVIAVSRAFILDLAGETAKSVELAEIGDRLLPSTDHLNRSIIPYIIGRAARYQGELDKAVSVYADFLKRGREAENVWPVASAVYEIAQVYRLQGRIRDALGLIEDFEAEADRFRVRGTGPVAKTFALKAEILRETGRLDEARSVAEGAVRHVDSWGLPSDIYVSHQFLARVLRSTGEFERAREELERFHDLPRRAQVYSSLYPAFEADRVRTWLALGELEPARAWAAETKPDCELLLVNREIERIALARVRLAADESAEESRRTAALLDSLAREAREGRRYGPLVEILVLQAEAVLRLEEKDEARRVLQDALRLGKPAGFAQTFLELGPDLLELL
jgi:LuxR family maltose regulon positive regulatory protein